MNRRQRYVYVLVAFSGALLPLSVLVFFFLRRSCFPLSRQWEMATEGAVLEDMELLEQLNQTLLVKERKSNDELQQARKELIAGLRELKSQSDIGVRRMGELDMEAFRNMCRERFAEEEAEIKAAELYFNWQCELAKYDWHPFKLVPKDQETVGLRKLKSQSNIGLKRMGELDMEAFRNMCRESFAEEEAEIKAAELYFNWQCELAKYDWYPFKLVPKDQETVTVQEIIDEGDEKLVKIKAELDEEVYEAVRTDLLEMNEHDPSGRYPVWELWNFKEGRKATLAEVIQCVLKQLKAYEHKAKDLN